MEELINKVKKLGICSSIFRLALDMGLTIHPESYLGRHISTVAQNGILNSSYTKLLILDISLRKLIVSQNHDWAKLQFTHLTKKICSQIEQIEVNSKNAAEIIATGLIVDIFKDAKALKESIKCKTPDICIGSNKFLEVYCPQESQPELTKVEKSLSDQNDMVKIVLSHPITGSDGSALTYPANKTIARVLNHKWSNDQTIDNAENILWLDLINGFEVGSSKTSPFESVNHSEHTYVGSFGIWHAFYGQEEKSLFSPDRTVLKFIEVQRGFYKQHGKNGIFRDRKSLSAALLLTTDGIVLFENPWALVPLSLKTKVNIRKLFRFRPEYSYFGVGCESLSENCIEEVLLKIEWLYQIS
ncbi:MAG: hypothetical protein ACT6FE_07700 [Methanosarcinaceae archaeon]